jgi:uncharacterized protein
MRLDLRSIINEAGVVPSIYEPDISDIRFEAISRVLQPLRAVGKVTNSAGVLTLTGKADDKSSLHMRRCGCEFQSDREIELDALLSAELEDKENPDIYLLEGDCADLDEIVITAFVFSLESKTLCREDCKGICQSCGKNLNDGPAAANKKPIPISCFEAAIIRITR